jgi:hypothetical protein
VFAVLLGLQVVSIFAIVVIVAWFEGHGLVEQLARVSVFPSFFKGDLLHGLVPMGVAFLQTGGREQDGISMLMPLTSACNLYDKWGKPDKLEPYIRQLLAVAEKQFGPTSPQLAPALTLEAHTLRSLGRAKEAGDVENRLASIRSATMSTP